MLAVISLLLTPDLSDEVFCLILQIDLIIKLVELSLFLCAKEIILALRFDSLMHTIRLVSTFNERTSIQSLLIHLIHYNTIHRTNFLYLEPFPLSL